MICLVAAPVRAADKLKVLLIDGQNNHDWKHTTPMLKWILEDSGRFAVDVSTTPPAEPRQPQAPKETATDKQKAAYDAAMLKWKSQRDSIEKESKAAWEQWHPKFSDYAAIVSNYNGQDWPASVNADFVDYIRAGGGLVSVHAADNAFPKWPEYNQMIGLGGWSGRNEKAGPMIRYRDGKFVRDDAPGAGGTHGAHHEFLVETRDADHPIMKGLGEKWMAATDELYGKLRGPAENMTVLATAFSSRETHGTGENEPILLAVTFGKGRIFQTTLGHDPAAMESLGFQVTLTRGTEWVATGAVTLPPPAPGELKTDHASLRTPPKDVALATGLKK